MQCLHYNLLDSFVHGCIIFQIHIGVDGRVIDDETGFSIEHATVSVATINKNVTTDQFGYYWRLLTAGTYTLSFHKEGWVDTCFSHMQTTKVQISLRIRVD